MEVSTTGGRIQYQLAQIMGRDRLLQSTVDTAGGLDRLLLLSSTQNGGTHTSCEIPWSLIASVQSTR